MNRSIETWQNAARDGLLNSPLASRISALYWIGSLAHGGFSDRYSDIDLAVIFHECPADAEAKLLRVQSTLPDFARWSIFWSDAKLAAGRMPTPDQIDLLDNGKLFFGDRPLFRDRPDAEALRRHLREISIPYWTTELDAGPRIGADALKYLVRLALYPARFAYSWETGRIDSNENAVRFLSGSTRWPMDHGLLAAALEARLGHAVEPEVISKPAVARQLTRVFASI